MFGWDAATVFTFGGFVLALGALGWGVYSSRHSDSDGDEEHQVARDHGQDLIDDLAADRTRERKWLRETEEELQASRVKLRQKDDQLDERSRICAQQEHLIRNLLAYIHGIFVKSHRSGVDVAPFERWDLLEAYDANLAHTFRDILR